VRRLARLNPDLGPRASAEETIAQIDAVTTGTLRDFAQNMAQVHLPRWHLMVPVDGAPTLEELQERRACLNATAETKAGH